MKGVFAFVLALATTALSGFPPVPQGVTTVNSKRTPGVSVSYKETYFCETTPGVKSYSGYVHLPSSLLQVSYNTSLFFWYFEARTNPQNAPLIIYLAGGVGESSMFGATMMGGPCYINEDANSTTLNPWSFNNEANVLYIDQPVQTGFSYDVLVNGTLDQLQAEYVPQDFSSDIPQTNATFLVGTFPSQNENQTANSSVGVSHVLYHFTQAFVNDFPKYNTKNTKINLWANSWGGWYGPATLAYFEMQNELLKDNPSAQESYSILDVDTLGLLNGCVDTLIEQPFYPLYLLNNTYMPLIDETGYNNSIKAFIAPKDGCKDLITTCRSSAALNDPQFLGLDKATNDKCNITFATCFIGVQGGNSIANASDPNAPSRSAFDISHFTPEAYPYTHISTFFNRDWVQSSLGVPVNFSALSHAVWNYPSGAFAITADSIRGNKSNVEYLLTRGKKVVLVYGDRDYRCNWLGAEAISLSVNFPGTEKFKSSGYAEVVTNTSYNGAVTRQADNLAFVRVFDAGHYPHATQPETVYRVLERSLKDLDLATGKEDAELGCGYTTKGPDNAWSWRNHMPLSPPSVCSTWFVDTCSPDQTDALKNGTAVVVDDIVVTPPGLTF